MHIGVEALGDGVLELCHKGHLQREINTDRQRKETY
jgi:hypothetical protein